MLFRSELFAKPEDADAAAPVEPQDEEEDDLELLDEELEDEEI